ncbi:MBL fold metallo-hydrolase [Christiangramia forsetii]|nr:MBL fold metallo-hydrolase [Christiangramia forsetii]GGG41886.1 membrane protein [Christiangramia forsetii]
MRNQFGAKPTNQDLKKYSSSDNWDGNKFINLEKTGMNISFQDIPKLLYKQFCEKKGREPKIPIPVAEFKRKDFLAPSDNAKFIWYGHSVILMRIKGQTMLIDPMFGSNAAPISPFSVKRFSKNTLDIIEKLPGIDLLLISHDHYDHLDYDSIKLLKSKVKRFGVALGVSRHLKKWNIPMDNISEFDWWDKIDFEGIEITFTPSRHFSGRGLKDRAKSLWGGWAFKTFNENIWFSGDGGYGKHFKEVGERLGPFDFGFMECGQYNEKWHQIHMFPEESVQAAIDAKADKIMAVHWAAFALAQHHWKDPIERFTIKAQEMGISNSRPQIGELFSVKSQQTKNWWEKID